MLEEATVGIHSYVGSQALNEVGYRFVDERHSCRSSFQIVCRTT